MAKIIELGDGISIWVDEENISPKKRIVPGVIFLFVFVTCVAIKQKFNP